MGKVLSCHKKHRRVAKETSNQGNAEPVAAKNETASESGPKCRGNKTDDEVITVLTASEFEDQQCTDQQCTDQQCIDQQCTDQQCTYQQCTARNEIEKLGTVSQELG